MKRGDWLLVVLVFGLCGPAIGTVIFGILAVVASSVGFMPERVGALLFFGGLALFPLAYVIGGLQALLCGLSMGLWIAVRRRPSPWWVPGGVGLVAGLLFAGEADSDAVFQAIIVAVHAFSGIACWIVARWLLDRQHSQAQGR